MILGNKYSTHILQKEKACSTKSGTNCTSIQLNNVVPHAESGKLRADSGQFSPKPTNYAYDDKL